MVKDRLEELKKKAQVSIQLSEKENHLIKIQNDSLDNVFHLAEKISGAIQNITENVEQCKCYMKDILECPFREKELSRKQCALFQENGKLTHEINMHLKQLENYVKQNNKKCTVGRIEATQFNTLKTRFRKCLQDNNEEMENFRKFRITTYMAQLKAKGMDVSEDEVIELLNADQQIQIFTDNHLVEAAEARRLLSEAEELNEQLLKIEDLIREIRDMFVQMSVLVEQQQELIDVIEYQTQETADEIVKIPLILKEADRKKSRARKMKYSCYGILVILLVLIAVSIIKG